MTGSAMNARINHQQVHDPTKFGLFGLCTLIHYMYITVTTQWKNLYTNLQDFRKSNVHYCSPLQSIYFCSNKVI